jgi:lysozyme
MQTNETGLKLIKMSEGLFLHTYLCPAGIQTIGYGHTGPDVKMGMTITDEQATALLVKDLKHFEDAVTKYVKVPLNENEFSALVSLSYNIGEGSPTDTHKRGLYWSPVLSYLNANQRQEAADSFLNHDKARDPKTKQLIELPGLKKRRLAERALFLTPVITDSPINLMDFDLIPIKPLEFIPTRAVMLGV